MRLSQKNKERKVFNFSIYLNYKRTRFFGKDEKKTKLEIFQNSDFLKNAVNLATLNG